jgi:hypothetical protein
MADAAISLPVNLATAIRASRAAALTLAISLPGDTVLYQLLPLLDGSGRADRRWPGHCWLSRHGL